MPIIREREDVGSLPTQADASTVPVDGLMATTEFGYTGESPGTDT